MGIPQERVEGSSLPRKRRIYSKKKTNSPKKNWKHNGLCQTVLDPNARYQGHVRERQGISLHKWFATVGQNKNIREKGSRPSHRNR